MLPIPMLALDPRSLKFNTILKPCGPIKMAYLDEPLTLQLPDGLRVMYSLQEPPNSSGTRWPLDLTVPAGSPLAAKLQALDQAILTLAGARSRDWFGRQLSPEDIADRYNPVLRPRPKGALSMRVKVETGAGKATAVTGGQDVFELLKGAEVAATVKLSGVWLSSSGFGLAVAGVAFRM
jgi:hypothetical protein